jgi:hypothetical protein
VILFIGLATIVSSLRLGLFTGLDRIALDDFERVLLVGDFAELRLLHKAKMSEREAVIAESDRPGMGESAVLDFAMRNIIRRRGPTYWWVVLELVISASGAAIPILGIFRL